MPDVSATERGKRYFQVMKEKQAEKVIARIQKRLGSDWQTLSHQEMKVLKFIIGEAWVYLDQKDWDSYPFNELSGLDVRQIIQIGYDLQGHRIRGQEAARQMEGILRERGEAQMET